MACSFLFSEKWQNLKASHIEFLRRHEVKNPEGLWSILPEPAKERLNILIEGDKVIEDKNFDSEISKFFKYCPEWVNETDEDVHLFWKKYSHFEHLKVLRLQTSRLCSMHAGVVLQHYLVTIGKNEPTQNVGMIDIAKYEAVNLGGEKLIKYLHDEFVIPADKGFFQLCSLDSRRDVHR